jgi:flagellar hook assembly protein FlgD
VTLAATLPRPGRVRLTIHDVRGRLVRELANTLRPTGRVSYAWDGRSSRGERVPAGTYFARLSLDGETRTSKMLLLP